jgi:hypothetical protein
MKTIEEIKEELVKLNKYRAECENNADLAEDSTSENFFIAQMEGCIDKIDALEWVLSDS